MLTKSNQPRRIQTRWALNGGLNCWHCAFHISVTLNCSSKAQFLQPTKHDVMRGIQCTNFEYARKFSEQLYGAAAAAPVQQAFFSQYPGNNAQWLPLAAFQIRCSLEYRDDFRLLHRLSFHRCFGFRLRTISATGLVDLVINEYCVMRNLLCVCDAHDFDAPFAQSNDQRCKVHVI